MNQLQKNTRLFDFVIGIRFCCSVFLVGFRIAVAVALGGTGGDIVTDGIGRAVDIGVDIFTGGASFFVGTGVHVGHAIGVFVGV